MSITPTISVTEPYVRRLDTTQTAFGRSSIQVMRRMRAMLERLSDDVPPERRAQVHQEIERLDATLAQSFKGSIDQDRASIADHEGIGGTGRSENASWETVSPAGR